MTQKLYLTLCLLCTIWTLQGQISLTRKDFTISDNRADTIISQVMQRKAFASPNGGNNQFWDYSNTLDSAIAPIRFVTSILDPFYVPFEFPKATGAYIATYTFGPFRITNNYQFERYGDDGYSIQGTVFSGGRFPLKSYTGFATDSVVLFPKVDNYTSNPLYYYKFPINTSSRSTWKYRNVINFNLTVALVGLDRSPGKVVTNQVQTDSTIGWGTLRLRNPKGGSPLDFAVLLVENIDRSRDSFYLSSTPAPDLLLNALGLKQNTIRVNKSYAFYGARFASSILSINYRNDTLIRVTRNVNPVRGLTTDLHDLKNIGVKTRLYPNPSQGNIVLEFEKSESEDWDVLVYNANGQMLGLERIAAPIGKVNYNLLLKPSLSNGSYFYHLLDQRSLIRSSGTFVLQR
jgi:Secretion system C-terminal sorting domain